MTCIVGLVDSGRVYLGGDSASVNTTTYGLHARCGPKVFRLGELAIGYTTSFRMGDLLAHAFKPPKMPKKTSALDGWMVNELVESARSLFRARAYSSTRDGQEWGGEWLVGVRGRLYCVGDNFQVARPLDGLHAIGCAADLAVGVLFATKGKASEARVRLALKVAERRSAGVRGPFKVVRT
jgi:hypothetical protein